MTIVINHIGKKGSDGQDGIDGTGLTGIGIDRLSNPLADPIRSNAVGLPIILERDGEALYTDMYGDEIPVAGKFIKHVLEDSNDLNSSSWIKSGVYITIDNTNSASPFGSNDATQITFADTTGGFLFLETLSGTVDYTPNKLHRFSCWIRLVSGDIDSIQVAMGGSTQEPAIIETEITGDWVRISTTVSSSLTSGGVLSFMPITEGCTIQVYEFQVTEGIGLYPITTTGSNIPLLVESGSQVSRTNQDGLLIEGAKENLCLNSQGLNNWQVLGVTPTDIQGVKADFFNGSVGLIKFTDAQSISVTRSGLTLTTAQSYAVSFYAKLVSGSIESASVSLGGDAEVFEFPDALERKEFIIPAGGGVINFNLVSSESGTSVVLTGIQIESDVTTSYTPTGFTSSSRPADNVSVDVEQLSSLQQPFSTLFSVRNLNSSDLSKYLFNISGELFSYIENDKLYVNNVEAGDVLNSYADFVFCYDGSELTVYIDDVLSYTTSISMTAKPSYFYIGSSDGAGANALNASMKKFTWWDYELTAQDAQLVRAN